MTIPIPHRVSGFLLGAPSADVTVDVFIDIQCPHSRKIWPNLLEVIQHYRDQSLSVRVHLITLSNHRQSWDMSLGLFALAAGDAQKFYDFATFIYDRQEQFYNGPFTHKTHDDLRELVAGFAEEHSGVDRADFLNTMDASNVYVEGRTPNRYAATKGVWGTPTLFINNAGKVPLDHSSSLSQWRNVIDPMLA